MNAPFQPHALTRAVHVDVVESRGRVRKGRQPCVIDIDLRFQAEKLQSYFFKSWDQTLYDTLLLAAAVEFCDMGCRRLVYQWARDIHLRIPVHAPDRWKASDVCEALHEALSFLTGDRWHINFVQRQTSAVEPKQGQFELPSGVLAVMPFSNGLDSCSVASLSSREFEDHELVRVRLGLERRDGKRHAKLREPFTSVPYKVSGPRKESSMRSRGFKFGIISALAAYLANANRIILPESGQGALGPVLASLGQVYPDYRTHPAFLRLMERFLVALLKRPIKYELPRLWNTKGETLYAHLSEGKGDKTAWLTTISCWQQNRHASVGQKARQCGICAACLLRRLSVHAAGQAEPHTTYVWENLSAPSFEEGAAPDFDKKKITPAMRTYAVAGALHLDHLAALRTSPASQMELDLNIFQLARACDLSEGEVRAKLARLLTKHEEEWRSFLVSLGPHSFLRQWVAVQ